MPPSKLALAFLDELERAETSLLTWGLVDTRFSEEEVEQRAREFLVNQEPQSDITDGWQLVEELLDQHLLWRLPDSDQYRTRMAETLRLLSTLRQIFPDPQNAAWRTAPRLVGGYRFLLQRRLFPSRSVPVQEVISQIRAEIVLSPMAERIVRALLRAGSQEERVLAGFQVRSAARLLRNHDSDRTFGTIICAGTAGGKTLAFYLPVYTALAERVSHEYWIKCLALYPRNELLKDQLREAIANARLLNGVLRTSGRRPLLIGALFGQVPHAGRYLTEPSGNLGWRRLSVRGQAGYECPYIDCPRCSQPMVWLEADVLAGEERLVCPASRCPERIQSDEFCLTRERMLRQPPDVLFTSTEMVNQRLSSVRYGRLLGIGLNIDRRPLFVLMDEVHTYDGGHGAHVASLVRRWRYASQARPHFVGLSATLIDAPRFFAELIGIGPGDVGEICPLTGELRADGTEYMAAVRGDVSSGASLLSTTIQSLMLIRRALDVQREGVYGTRVFAFTDDLDVTNRLYHSLLDAEGADSSGRPRFRGQHGSLANLRATTLPNSKERFYAGQNWAMAEDIGHSLVSGSRLRVARTSSQDVGVDPHADVIVATATLEVGFDDPEVGAVLQHKAPHSAASFLQRKGRGGRRQGSRPWTIVVLSNWGRDRRAFRDYDQLFSPILAPRHLPILNRTILRMQAVYVLFDWLARRVPPGLGADPWGDLSEPPDSGFGDPDRLRQRHQAYIGHARTLLENDTIRSEFSRFLGHALSVEEDVVTALLWEPPRALLTEAVPTLLRRLEREWRQAGEDGREPFESRSPLPEFAPRALFSDLLLPETAVRLPKYRMQEPRVELMPLVQAVSEFAPGRVSRRFGVAHAGERHWIDPGDGGELLLDSVCPGQDRYLLGEFTYRDAQGHLIALPVYRPLALQASVPPEDVLPSSNAFLEWHTQIVPTSDGHQVETPTGCAWSNLIHSVRFHTHHLGLPLELRRFAIGARCSLTRKGVQSVEREVVFRVSSQDGGRVAAGLGFAVDVDGVEIAFRYPSDLITYCSSNERLLRGLRRDRYRDLVREDSRLEGAANRFQRDLLTEMYLAAVIAEAVRGNVSLVEAESMIHAAGRQGVFSVMETVLCCPQPGSGDAEENEEHGEDLTPRRVRELRDLLERHETWEMLHDLADALWQVPDSNWAPWLRARYKTTLGAALLQAACDLCPRTDPEALTLDLEARPTLNPLTADSDELWITESTIGGGGFVEDFLVRYAEDPRRFFRFVEAGLGPSESEVVGEDLERALAHAIRNPPSLITEAFEAVRSASSYHRSTWALAQLRSELAQNGIEPTTELLVAMNARLLGPGTNPQLDSYLAALIRDWRDTEERLGVEVDIRTFAYIKSNDPELEHSLGINAANMIGDNAGWRYGVLCGMLWPHGIEVREESLRPYSRYTRLSECEPLLLREAVTRNVPTIALTRDGAWIDLLSVALIEHGVAELTADLGSEQVLAGALRELATEPLDTGGLLVYPQVVALRRDARSFRVSLELPEAPQ